MYVHPLKLVVVSPFGLSHLFQFLVLFVNGLQATVGASVLRHLAFVEHFAEFTRVLAADVDLES